MEGVDLIRPPLAHGHFEKDLEVQRSMTGIQGLVWLSAGRNRTDSTGWKTSPRQICSGFINCCEWHRKVTKEFLVTSFCKVRSRDINRQQLESKRN